MSKLNIEKLNAGQGKEFIKQLAGVPNNLDKNNIKEFYSTLSSLFDRDDLQENSLNQSLIALYKVLTCKDDYFLKVFQEKDFISRLPYNTQYQSAQNSLFDVLYAISSNAPASFNEFAADQISQHLLQKDQMKTLTIIGIYAKKFDELKKPWEMLDILIKNSQDFYSKDECCQNYVSLLAFLCKKDDYRKERIEECWECVCNSLNTNNEPILATVYNCLCILYELDREKISTLDFPIEHCSNHLLKKQDVSQSVISLLFRYQPNFDPGSDGRYFSRSRRMSTSQNYQSSLMLKLIQSLTQVATNDVNANLILVKMATDENIARLILHDSTWMVKNLPSAIDTMRLFAVILSHENLRNVIMSKKETIDFLKQICNLNASGVLTAICIFIRRFPLTEEYINELSNNQFLTQFFSTAFEHNDETTLHAALVMADTVAKICCVQELPQYCKKIAELSKSDSTLALTAGKVAVEMCKYPECVLKFKALKLDEYYAGKVRNQHLKKIAIHFLKEFKATSQKIKNDKDLTMSHTATINQTNYDSGSDSVAAALSPPVTPKVKYTNLESPTRNTRSKNPI